MKEEAKKTMDKQSIHTLILLRFDFPFVGTTPYLDVYSLFSVDPLNVFYLNLSRLIKEWPCNVEELIRRPHTPTKTYSALIARLKTTPEKQKTNG